MDGLGGRRESESLYRKGVCCVFWCKITQHDGGVNLEVVAWQGVKNFKKSSRNFLRGFGRGKGSGGADGIAAGGAARATGSDGRWPGVALGRPAVEIGDGGGGF